MLIFFSQQETSLLSQYGTHFTTKKFQSFDEWNKERIAPTAFIIVGSDANYVLSILGSIRRDEAFFATLCFISGPVDELNGLLADGELPSPESLQKAVRDFANLEIGYKNDEDSRSHLGRLTKYLWLRPQYIIHPYHQWQYVRYYRYPLLEALALDELEVFDWLRSLEKIGVLEPLALLDRQTECRYCNSSHLNFIDICPNCRSKDIELYASLHCFTCGHVDIQEKFISTGALVCPNCLTQLQHIGSDYDRPIENHRCMSCSHTFIEDEVVSQCAVCRNEMLPSELVSNRIYSWQLSSRGRMLAVYGGSLDVSASFGQIGFVSTEIFFHNLNWLMLLSRRYSDSHFSMFGIYFANLAELTDYFGYTTLYQMLESFAQHLRGLLRTTDISTRTAENMIWLLLPHTDDHELKGLQNRIENSLHSLFEDSEKKLDCRYVSTTSSKIQETENAELLLARMQGQLM